jgi:uncharacterized lipoprotein YddW (UPF0748 family)
VTTAVGGLRVVSAAALLVLASACTRVGGTVPRGEDPRTGPIGVPLPERGGRAGPLPGTPVIQTPSGTTRPLLRFSEVRGLWVVRYSMVSPASVRAVVDRASAAGFNTLMVQVRGRGDAFYASALEPRGEALARQPISFDPLAEIIEAAHARGMGVHAWMNVDLVSDLTELPTDPRHIADQHPEALMVPRALARELNGMRPSDPRYGRRLLEWSNQNTDRVEGLYESPWSAPVRERAAAVAADLAERYDLDGIHLDYIRYPGPEFDFSAGSLNAFRAWAAPLLDSDQRRRLDRGLERDPLAWADSLPQMWQTFRREQVTTLVERIQIGVKAKRPWVIVSAAIFPDTVDARRDRGQDWPTWAREGLVDALAPMAYGTDDRRFRDQIETVMATAPRTEVWAGIGSYLSGLDGTLSKIAIARRLGTRGVLLFSYDWAVDPKGGGSERFMERLGLSFGR